MADRRTAPVYADVAPDVLDRLRVACGRLPDVREEQAWAGRRWRVRNRTFVHVFCVDRPDGPVTFIQFRSSGPELDTLLAAGHPFHRAGWGSNVMMMILDEGTDWDEVGELVTESYCLLAPKNLVSRVDRPDET